jgi:hypothetical protein
MNQINVSFISCTINAFGKIFVAAVLILFSISCSRNTVKQSASSSSSKEVSEDRTLIDQRANETKVTADSVKRSNAEASSKLSEITYSSKDIPADILRKIEGEIVASAGFTDLDGKNIVLITESEQSSGNDATAGKSLFGYHFIGDNESQLLWKIQDFIRDCEVDVTLEYIENSLSVSDIDEDGIGESTFLYKLSCKGDVSPDDLKLLMHEGDKKYAIRGSMDLDVTGYGLEKGVMNIDASFNNAPSGFKDFAVERWNKFKLERIGN